MEQSPRLHQPLPSFACPTRPKRPESQRERLETLEQLNEQNRHLAINELVVEVDTSPSVEQQRYV